MKQGFAMRILWELEKFEANQEDMNIHDEMIQRDEIPRRAGRVPNQRGEEGITNVKRGW